MAWDLTAPAGTDAISNGDNEIRTFKTDVQTSLRGNAADGTEAIFPGSDTANPIYRYRGLRGATGARPATGQYGLYVDTTRNAIQRDNGSSWNDIATLIPAGTKMIFFQASAPTGWTKDTTYNDYALRVVTGSGGGTGGGPAAFSTALAGNSGAGSAHTHTMDSHTHSGDTTAGAASGGAGIGFESGAFTHYHITAGSVGATTSVANTEAANVHPVFATAPYYADVIICTKD